MASTIKSDNGATSGVTGIIQTADNTGQLTLQTTTSGGATANALTIDNSQNITLNSTGAITLNVGNTAQRPSGANGSIRYNSETAGFEGYAAGAWGSLGGSSVSGAINITLQQNFGGF